MDNREANNSTLKSTHHQSDIDNNLSILVEVVCASTQQEVCIFIFICFCSFVEVRGAHISLQTYYLHERPIAVTSVPHPWLDRRNDVLGRTSEESLRRQRRMGKKEVNAASESLVNGGCGAEARTYHSPPSRRRVPLIRKFRVMAIFLTTPLRNAFFNSKTHLDSSANPTRDFSTAASTILFTALAHKNAGNNTPLLLMRTASISTPSLKYICYRYPSTRTARFSS